MKNRKKKSYNGMDQWMESYNRNFGYSADHVPSDSEESLPPIVMNSGEYSVYVSDPVHKELGESRSYHVKHPELCKRIKEPICIENIMIGKQIIRVLYPSRSLTQKEFTEIRDGFSI